MNTIFNDSWVALKKVWIKMFFCLLKTLWKWFLFCIFCFAANWWWLFSCHTVQLQLELTTVQILEEKNYFTFQLTLLLFPNTSPSHILARCCSTFDVTCSTFGKASHNPPDKYAQVQTMDVVCGRYNIPCLVLCSLRYTSGSRNLVGWWTKIIFFFTEHSCF